MKPPLRMNTKQARELGLIKKGQLWHNGQAYLGQSGRSYEDYIKDGGPEIPKDKAVDLGLCSRHQFWFEGEAIGPKGPYEVFLNQVQNGKLQFKSLDFSEEDLTSLPAGLQVGGDLDLKNCKSLETLPSGLKVGGNLNLGGCKSLKSLPSGLQVGRGCDLEDCKSLKSLPPDLKVGGDLSLTGCTSLKSLPPDLKVGGDLYLYGCNSLDIQSFKELRKNKGVKGTIRGVTEILKAKA